MQLDQVRAVARESGEETPPAQDATAPSAAPRTRPWLTPIALAEGGLLTDVAIILDLVAIYLPLLGTVVAPAVPAPFAVLMLRRGARVTLLTAGVSAFLMTILTGPHFGWRMGLQALIGLLMGWAMRRRLSWIITVTLGALLVTTVGFAATLGLILVIGMPLTNILELLRNGLQSVDGFAAFVAGLTGARDLWGEIHRALVPAARQALELWPALLYAYYLAFAVPAVLLYYAVASASARVLGHDVPAFPPVWVSRLVWRLLAPIRLLRRGTRHGKRGGGKRGQP